MIVVDVLRRSVTAIEKQSSDKSRVGTSNDGSGSKTDSNSLHAGETEACWCPVLDVVPGLCSLTSHDTESRHGQSRREGTRRLDISVDSSGRSGRSR